MSELGAKGCSACFKGAPSPGFLPGPCRVEPLDGRVAFFCSLGLVGCWSGRAFEVEQWVAVVWVGKRVMGLMLLHEMRVSGHRRGDAYISTACTLHSSVPLLFLLFTEIPSASQVQPEIYSHPIPCFDFVVLRTLSKQRTDLSHYYN